jgi:hypothetical protein
MPAAFVRNNPVVSRILLIRGDQTLADLHRAIFEAFGRQQEQMYEFSFGKSPSDLDADRYVLPGAVGMTSDGGKQPAGLVTKTTIGALGLTVGGRFAYWFDFAADWWHAITVKRISDKENRGPFPKVTARVGEDPPREAGVDLMGSEGPLDISEDSAADMSCLIGDFHFRKGDHHKAIEAYTRAIDSRPTPDAYVGRARAYRALAARDERKAGELGGAGP